MKRKTITSWEEYKKGFLTGTQNNVYDNYPETDQEDDIKYDIVYIVALSDEMDHLLNVFNIDDSNYKEHSGLQYIGFSYKVNGKELNIAILKPCGMGLVPASMAITQAIILMKPRLIMMTGVCATPKDKANFGDILLFDSVYLHDEGKITEAGLQPDIRTINVSKKVSDTFDKVIGLTGQINLISKKWPEKMTRREPLEVKRGVAASGMAVIANEKSISEKINHQRKLLAIDMESYAIAYCATSMYNECDWAVIKSVQDNGDSDKKDTYRHYACYTSARCSILFLEQYFSK